MEFVKNLNFYGVEAKEIPCLTGEGAPTTATAGAVGCLYMDTATGDMYKCTAVASGVYTWVALVEDTGSKKFELVESLYLDAANDGTTNYIISLSGRKEAVIEIGYTADPVYIETNFNIGGSVFPKGTGIVHFKLDENFVSIYLYEQTTNEDGDYVYPLTTCIQSIVPTTTNTDGLTVNISDILGNTNYVNVKVYAR